MRPMNYFSISSQLLIEEAQKFSLKTEILVPEKNLFIISHQNKSVMFKSVDF